MAKKIKYKKISNKSGRNFCDHLWTEVVKIRDGNKCVICGDEKYLNAHHLISRKVFKYRWKIDNGISLCPLHHNFSVELSAHTAPWGIEDWLKENRPEQYKVHVIDRNNIENVKTNYDEVYHSLENEYKKLTGDFFRIKRIEEYILYINQNIIVSLANKEDHANEFMDLYKISEKTFKTFIKKNKIGN